MVCANLCYWSALLCELFNTARALNYRADISLLSRYYAFHLYRKDDNKDIDSEKEAAMEAEIKAARERAIVPLEARMKQFKDMLLERGVGEACLLVV